MLVVAAWFITGAILLFTNKILLTNGIRAPVSITMLHMTASCLFANSAVLFGGFAAQSFKSNRQRLNVFVLASAFGCSVVAGVSSFAFIPVSFYEVRRLFRALPRTWLCIPRLRSPADLARSAFGDPGISCTRRVTTIQLKFLPLTCR